MARAGRLLPVRIFFLKLPLFLMIKSRYEREYGKEHDAYQEKGDEKSDKCAGCILIVAIGVNAVVCGGYQCGKQTCA